MKWKLLWRRLSVTAPRMTIKTHRPWWVQALVWVLILGFSGALALWTYDLGRRIAGLDRGEVESEIASLKKRLARSEEERVALSANANAANSHLAIERATLEKLMSQVKTLEAENTRLREDLAFFERMAPAPANPGVSIRNFTLQNEPGGTGIRYRLLIGQGGKTERDFVGSVQLLVTMLQGGQTVTLTLPEAVPGKAPGNPAFALSFRTFQRLEGTIALPEQAVLKSVQARVLENGLVRAQQTAALGRL